MNMSQLAIEDGIKVLMNLAKSFGYPACVLGAMGGKRKMNVVACNEELTTFLGSGPESLIGKHMGKLMGIFFRNTPRELLADTRRRHRALIAQGNAGSIQHVQSWFVVDNRHSCDVTRYRGLSFVLIVASRYEIRVKGRYDFLSLVQFLPRKFDLIDLPVLIRVYDHADGFSSPREGKAVRAWFGTDLSRTIQGYLRLFVEICNDDLASVMNCGFAKGCRAVSAVCAALQLQRKLPADLPTSSSAIRSCFDALEKLFRGFPPEAWKEIDPDCRTFRLPARRGTRETWSAFGRLAFQYSQQYCRSGS